MAVSDDEIIRKKLLIEGDGGNDDRRINSLLKTFMKWSCSEADEESNVVYQRMLSILAQCELGMEKTLHVYNMNKVEQENYQKLNDKIEKSIKDAYEKIADCKSDLHKAKRIRRNRQEYDALAKVIQQHPDRQETTQQLEALDKELASLKDSKESLEQKLELRRKQFHVLITAIHEMQRILDDDEKKEEQEEQTSMDTS